jgi:hypothetical protein
MRHRLSSVSDRRKFFAQLVATVGASPSLHAHAADRTARGPVTRVERVGGVPTFTVDGQPFMTPAFETYSPQQKFFAQFAAAQTRLFSFSTNAAACDYGHSRPTWQAEQSWDYSQLEERARRVLAARPDALLMPRVNLGTPRWWLDRHADSWERFDDGTAIPDGEHATLPPGRPFPSLACATWRGAIAEALRRLIDHVQQSRWGPHIFGWFLSGLHTEEFYHWACSTNRLAGYSAPTIRAFRRWLRSRYGSDQALRNAWGDPAVTLRTASVPSPVRRRDAGDGAFREPAGQQDVLDFYAFWNELIPDTIDHFAAIARQATGGQKVIGAFYGYLYEFQGDPEFGHNAAGKLLRSPHVDFMAVTASYHSRAAGTGGDYARSPALSLRLHGKLWYHDNDVVSYRAREIMEQIGFADDADWTRNLSGQLAALGYTRTPQQSRWMYRRGLGFALCHGMYPSWFDLHGGYFDSPELMAEVKHLAGVARRCESMDRSSCAQILVIADEESCSLAAPRTALLRRTLLEPQNAWVRIGAPVDHVLLTDVERLEVAPYRLVIFLNCWRLDRRQRQWIRRRLMNAGRHVLWCGGAGWFDASGDAAGHSQELIGFPLRRRDDSAHPFALQDASGRSPSPAVSSPAGAVARRECGDWTSLWTPTPALPAGTYRELARSAGVHIFHARDDVLYLNRSLLCLHAQGDGARRLRFPRPVSLVDLIHDRLVASRAVHWETVLRHGETALVRIEPPLR